MDSCSNRISYFINNVYVTLKILYVIPAKAGIHKKKQIPTFVGMTSTVLNLIKSMNRKIKIGIDVGGTFTHAVAVDISDFKLVGKSCVPTTHKAKEGVARGVVDSMKNLLTENNIHPAEVALIAHSTTQATNALLEGDVAVVGIIGMAKGVEGIRAKKEINLKNIELSPGKFLRTRFRFINTSNELTKELVKQKIEELLSEGAQVIVASEAFGVDDTKNEDLVIEVAESMNLLSSAASRISKLYGLRVRTRTAVINASMMPKMLETANMTELAIRHSGIKAPLMVMRSDGGIMDINEMRRRPILTMLSGPAAGVAAALMYEKVSDGIFLEVGGTSTDISVIKNGKPQIKSAQIGGNRLYLRTLDVRTLGIAGGSVPRFHKNKIIDVGPRSAHIAQLNYVAFSDEDFSDIELEKIQPLENDPDDYLSIKTKSNQKKFTITPTEASYQLNLVKEKGHSVGNIASIKKIFSRLSEIFNRPENEIAEEILSISANKIKSVIEQLIREYKLDKELVELVGGGGGASAIVPFTSKYLNFPHRIAKDCEVISAIGAALGMIRDSVEKTMINPTDSDIIALRQQAFESVAKMGANPETIEVSVEIDTTNKKVIAVAMGSSEMRLKDLKKKFLTEEELSYIASKSLRTTKENLNKFFESEFFIVFNHKRVKKHLFGLVKDFIDSFRVIDKEGTIKLQLQNGLGTIVSVGEIKSAIAKIISELTSFGDAGALVPDIFIVASSRIIDFTGLINEQQIISLAEFELSKISQNEQILILASQKK